MYDYWAWNRRAGTPETTVHEGYAVDPFSAVDRHLAEHLVFQEFGCSPALGVSDDGEPMDEDEKEAEGGMSNE